VGVGEAVADGEGDAVALTVAVGIGLGVGELTSGATPPSPEQLKPRTASPAARQSQRSAVGASLVCFIADNSNPVMTVGRLA
jgi:hypothetical protein